MLELPVNEIFQTVQGEGSHTGTPSVFIRLQGCAVGCAWCDTKHTWPTHDEARIPVSDLLRKTAAPVSSWAPMSTEALVGEVQRHAARHVVITGGEPCAYDLRELTTALYEEARRSVQIETSGTYPILCDWRTFVTVSPKLDMPGGRAVLPEALRRADELKVPVGRARDVDAFEARVRVHAPRAAPVYLQPLSQSATATRLCVELATERGYRVSVQVHKYLGLR